MSVNVAAIREALSKATAGPWSARDRFYLEADTTVDGDHLWVGETEFSRDAELIVLLRNNADALLDRLDQAERERDAAHERISELTSTTSHAFADRLRDELRAREMVQDPEAYFARARAEYAKIKVPTMKQGVLDLLARVKGKR